MPPDGESVPACLVHRHGAPSVGKSWEKVSVLGSWKLIINTNNDTNTTNNQNKNNNNNNNDNKASLIGFRVDSLQLYGLGLRLWSWTSLCSALDCFGSYVTIVLVVEVVVVVVVAVVVVAAVVVVVAAAAAAVAVVVVAIVVGGSSSARKNDQNYRNPIRYYRP